jgi:hypothetical protein
MSDRLVNPSEVSWYVDISLFVHVLSNFLALQSIDPTDPSFFCSSLLFFLPSVHAAKVLMPVQRYWPVMSLRNIQLKAKVVVL